MTAEEDVLLRVIEVFRAIGIPYMVTGSIAASYHGRPRATHDADVVIDPLPEQLERLVGDLERLGFHLNAETARQALRHSRSFNAIEIERAVKIDLIVKKPRPFSVEEFDRRQPVDFPFATGVTTVTAEDAILSKLDWSRQGGDSERQVRDAAGIVELNPTLDWDYIRRWASQLGVSDLWERIAPRQQS